MRLTFPLPRFVMAILQAPFESLQPRFEERGLTIAITREAETATEIERPLGARQDGLDPARHGGRADDAKDGAGGSESVTV